MRNYSEEVAKTIDNEVQKIITDCYKKAKDILTKSRDKMEEIVSLLMEREVISGDELRELLNGKSNESAETV